MAEDPDQPSLSASIKELISEVKDQKRQISSIQEEFRVSSAIVSSQVKKLKTKQEYSWKRLGNKIQFSFNSEIEDSVKQSLWALDNNKLDYLRELLQETDLKLKQRNKLIKIADGSEGGWETVRQYQSNPVASGSEDESKIFKAEARAVRKKKNAFKSKSTRSVPPSTVTGSAMLPGSMVPWGGVSGYPFVPPTSTGPAFAPAFTPRPRLFRPFQGPAFWPGTCFACGNSSHFRRDCPLYTEGPRVQRPAAPLQVTGK